MSESTRQIVEAIRRELSSARSRLLLARLATGLVVSLGIALLLWLVFAGAEALLWMTSGGRTAAVVAGAILLVLLLGRLVLEPVARLARWLKEPVDDRVADLVEKRVPATRDRLLNLLHLSTGRHTESPGDVVDAAIRMLAEPISTVSFDDAEDFRSTRRALRYAALPALALAIVLLAAPGPFLGATSRLAHPTKAFSKPAPFTLAVQPGDTEVIRGDSLKLVVAVDGEEGVVPEINIRRSGERTITTVRTDARDAGTFAYVEPNIRQDFEYRASADPVVSPWFRVVVVDRPAVRRLRAEVESPAYSGIGKTELPDNVGDVTALPGSRVRLRLDLGGSPTQVAEVVFDDGQRAALDVTGNTAAGEFRLLRTGSYQVRLTSHQGVTSTDPITYRLGLLVDDPPSVVILTPEPVSELADPFEPTLSARLTDDYGIRRMSLMYRLAQSRFGSVQEIFEELPLADFSRRELDQVVEHAWKMRSESGLSPVPGDVVEYFVRVWDNDTFRGYKSADSRIYQFVLPSLAEQYREIEEQSSDTEDGLEELLDKTLEVEERFEELRDELRRKPEADWDDARQLEQIEELQTEVEKGLDDVAAEIEDVARRLEESGLLSEETLDTYQELQRAIEEIQSPELMEALQKLREAMQSMDLQQMQQSMQDFQFNEQQFKERLERALELFKRLQARQVLEETARRAEELARLQEELQQQTRELDEQDGEQPQGDASPADSTEDAEDEIQRQAEELARQQDQAEREMEDIEQRLEDAQDMMEELKGVPTEELEKIRSQLENRDVPEQMRQNAEQLRQQQLKPAMQGQQQMQQQLQQLQQQLSEMQQGMEGRQLQLNAAGLRKALNDVLILSKQQEATMTGVGATAADSPSLRRHARRQTELEEGLKVVADTLRSLAREVPEMSREVQSQTGSAVREMAQATEALADRSARRATGHQKASMMHLNELALLLSDLLDMLMNQQMNMGMPSMQQMLQQLQQMAGQQQQLNQQIQEMLNDMHGQRLTQDMQARMRQLARQQEQLKEQLKELSRNPELRGNALGDLNRIAEQMEETIRELQQLRQSRNLEQRQQEILTRLLDASRSMNTRGREERRESRPGETPERTSPAELTPDEQADRLRRDLIRALESGYTPDYEELIKRYFELLQSGASETGPE